MVWSNWRLNSTDSRDRVIDDEGHEVLKRGPNNPGEILVRGPITMRQYLDNPVATSEQIDGDGWNHTGDVGYFGKDDKLYLIDRKKVSPDMCCAGWKLPNSE